MTDRDSSAQPTRRAFLSTGLGVIAAGTAPLVAPRSSLAAPAEFDKWREGFRARALARGVSEQTFARVMGRIEPDMSVFAQIRNQPEFNEQLWQYLNRRVSDWRIIAGKERLQEFAPLFARIERDFGVERGVMLGLWGIESAFGDPVVQQNHMRPVIPALAALAWR